MAIDVKRKQNESAEGLLRRFSQRVLQSRILQLARQKRFRVKPKNKLQRKQAAKVRNYNRAKREYLQKIGKLPENLSRFGSKSYTQKLVMGSKKKK